MSWSELNLESNKEYYLEPHHHALGFALTYSYLGSIVGFSQDVHPNQTSTDKAVYNGMTVMNIIGYIPGVSLIVGIARILFAQLSDYFSYLTPLNNETACDRIALAQAQTVRGVLECLSVFGPLQMITDIAVTIFVASAQAITYLVED